MANRVASSITTKLQTILNPLYLEIINESYMHNVPKDSESHFKVIVVSNEFQDKTPLQRHRWVSFTLYLILQYLNLN